MSKARQRERKKRVTWFIPVPMGVKLGTFQVLIDGKPFPVKGVGNGNIILRGAPPHGKRVEVRMFK